MHPRPSVHPGVEVSSGEAQARGPWPMKRRMLRIPFTVSATILFLVISFNSSPINPAARDPHQVPLPSDDKVVLEDLASWMVGARHGNDLQVMSSTDLDAALDPEPRR